MLQNPVSDMIGFSLGIGGYVAGVMSPWRKQGVFVKILASITLAAALLVAVLCWVCLIEIYWYQDGSAIITDQFDIGHPISMWCLAILSFIVCTMTFYWEDEGREDVHWPYRWIVFRATTTLITAFILSNGV